MTKVYDALRQAEAERHAKTAIHAPAAAPTPIRGVAQTAAPAGADEIERLRHIVLGSAVSDFDAAVRRVEERIVAQTATLRDELAKFEERIEERLGEVDYRSTKAQADLRESILSQSNELGDRIKERSAEAVRLLNAGLEELRETKMDGTEFSTFVHALAGHLVEEKR